MILAVADLALYHDEPQHIILRKHILNVGINLGNRVYILSHKCTSA